MAPPSRCLLQMLSKLYTWLDITASTAVTIAVAISFFFSAFVIGNRFSRFHFSSSPFSGGRENALAVVMPRLGPEARSTEEGRNTEDNRRQRLW